MGNVFAELLERRRLLHTPRLVLRSPQEGDARALAALANDFGVAEMLARLPHPYGVDDAERFIAAASANVVFAVTRRADGLLLGICGVRPTERGNAVDLGYWLGRLWWGRGYATESAHAVIDLAFEVDGIGCVLAGCRAVNGRSRRVLEKCGFQLRGTGSFVSMAAGRVASEQFGLERRVWASLKAWGREATA